MRFSASAQWQPPTSPPTTEDDHQRRRQRRMSVPYNPTDTRIIRGEDLLVPRGGFTWSDLAECGRFSARQVGLHQSSASAPPLTAEAGGRATGEPPFGLAVVPLLPLGSSEQVGSSSVEVGMDLPGVGWVSSVGVVGVGPQQAPKFTARKKQRAEEQIYWFKPAGGQRVHCSRRTSSASRL